MSEIEARLMSAHVAERAARFVDAWRAHSIALASADALDDEHDRQLCDRVAVAFERLARAVDARRRALDRRRS